MSLTTLPRRSLVLIAGATILFALLFTSTDKSKTITVMASSFEDQRLASNYDPDGNGYLDSDREAIVALPDRSALGRTVAVRWNGVTKTFPVADVGPFNTTDPYWESGSAPDAEGNSGVNKSGIDLSFAAWEALGAKDTVNRLDQVQWWFVN